jgi:FkbM family methyltransferase
MVGATGNYYFGLHEFQDMGFLLHYLRKGELFVDIGANVGSYTVLAAAVRQTHVVAIEPIPSTFRRLLDNVHVNALEGYVRTFNIGLGASEGYLRFSTQLDAENHVLSEDEQVAQVVEVQVRTLDDLLGEERPVMIKMDVEGFETEVIRGGESVFASPHLQALLIELNGAGVRYGFDENAIRERLEYFGMHLCSYDPLTRRLIPKVQTADVMGGNSLYVRYIHDAQIRLAAASPFCVMGRQI